MRPTSYFALAALAAVCSFALGILVLDPESTPPRAQVCTYDGPFVICDR